LRQDPDVILVGEIRDAETADMALQAALTGHIVFSTLHTNDAVGAVPRLVDLGVKPSTIAPALSLVIAQRLVRKLCVHCRREVEPSAQMKEDIKAFLTSLPEKVERAPYAAHLNGSGKVFEPVGCDQCNGFGYKGRIGVFEFFRKDDAVEEAIVGAPSPVALRKLARTQQMVTMQQDGVLKSLLGVTTLTEVIEVTGPISWK
jgi:type II secretory ATPase GspE/PulE/Tfp pilus assembly ATPase PilB-like protein